MRRGFFAFAIFFAATAAAEADIAVIKAQVQSLQALQPVAEATVRFSGPGVNASTAFLATIDDAVASATDFLSVDDLYLEAVSFSPCDVDGKAGAGFQGPVVTAAAAAEAGAPPPPPAGPAKPPPIPPPRRALRGASRSKCVPTVDVSVQVRRNTTLSSSQLAALRSALVGDSTLRRLRAEGVRLDDATLLHFAETAINPELSAPAPPVQGSVGKDTVTFKLMLVGPAASVSNGELVRTLHSIIVANLTSGPVDYVTPGNTRVLNVAVTPSSMVMPAVAAATPAAPGATRPREGRAQAPAPAPPGRRRLAQMLAGAIPASVVPDAGAGDGDSHTKVPDLPPPHVRAALPDEEGSGGTSKGTAPSSSSGLPEAVPAVDITFQVARLPRAGCETLYTQLSHAIVTNALTAAMMSAGWNINSVTDALGVGGEAAWFTVNGRPFGETGRGGPPTFVETAGGGGRGRDTNPGVIAAAALVPALLAAGLAAACYVAYARRAGSGGGGGGKAVPTVGLGAAIAAAAARSGSGGAPSAAALLGITTTDGGAGAGDTTSTATASGKDASAHGGCGYAALAERDWQLDPASLLILTRPDGSEWELGSGASGRVYKALLGGAQEVAVKVFSEKLPALVVSDGGGGGSGGAAGEPQAKRPSRARPAWLARLVRTPAPRDDDTAGERGPEDGPVEKTVSDPAGRGGGSKGAALGGAGASRSDPTSSTAAAATGPGSRPPTATAGSSVAATTKQQPHHRRVPLLEELAREVLLLRACHDRNIVSFVGASIQAGHAVLVTEYMPGGDLHAAIAEDAASGKGRFTWRRRLGPAGKPLPRTGVNRQTALDIARGLHFLHARRIVHLDLKSPNILLGRDGTAKIADVGLSKVLRDNFVSTMHAVGTYAWAAPEVLMGKPTSEAADIYSFGVLLWELSVREAPAGRHLRPVEVPEEAPASVVELMDRCLASDPAARPTALELVHFFVDLGRAASGSGTTAAVEETGEPGAKAVEVAAARPGRRLSWKKEGAAAVPASGFGEVSTAAAASEGVPPVSAFGDVQAPRPVGRPGVSGPPARGGGGEP